jgi:hypothetical protein
VRGFSEFNHVEYDESVRGFSEFNHVEYDESVNGFRDLMGMDLAIQRMELVGWMDYLVD